MIHGIIQDVRPEGTLDCICDLFCNISGFMLPISAVLYGETFVWLSRSSREVLRHDSRISRGGESAASLGSSFQ